MITVLRENKHPSSGANRSSDVAVTVNINAEFNLIAVNPIIECFSRDLVTEYCQCFQCSAVYTVPPDVVETLPGRSYRSLPRLPFHMHEQAIIPTYLSWNINIGLRLAPALTMTGLPSYEIFEDLSIVRIKKSVDCRRILHIRGQRDAFLYQLS